MGVASRSGKGRPAPLTGAVQQYEVLAKREKCSCKLIKGVLARHLQAIAHQLAHMTLGLVPRLSPGESAAMDPQGRLLLEQAGLALGDAGGRQGLPVATAAGVYVGVMHMEYIQFMNGMTRAAWLQMKAHVHGQHTLSFLSMSEFDDAVVFGGADHCRAALATLGTQTRMTAPFAI